MKKEVCYITNKKKIENHEKTGGQSTREKSFKGFSGQAFVQDIPMKLKREVWSMDTIESEENRNRRPDAKK